MHTKPVLAFIALSLAGACDGSADDSSQGDGSSGSVSTSGSAETTGSESGISATSGSATTGGDPASTTSEASTSATGGESTSSDTTSTTSDDGSSSGAPPAVNLFENGSLEAWPEDDIINSYPDGWSDCESPALGLEAVPEACPAAVPETAADGERYARGYYDERFGQVVDTVPGETYTVSLAYAAISNCYGGGVDSSWEIIVDGSVLATTPSEQGVDAWATYTIDFVATAATTEICFRKPTGSGAIDALSVTVN